MYVFWPVGQRMSEFRARNQNHRVLISTGRPQSLQRATALADRTSYINCSLDLMLLRQTRVHRLSSQLHKGIKSDMSRQVADSTPTQYSTRARTSVWVFVCEPGHIAACLVRRLVFRVLQRGFLG